MNHSIMQNFKWVVRLIFPNNFIGEVSIFHLMLSDIDNPIKISQNPHLVILNSKHKAMWL